MVNVALNLLFDMKLMYAVLMALLVCCLGCGSNVRAEEPKTDDQQSEYDVYLLIGQSNMAGRGPMLASDREDVIDGVWLLNAEALPEPAVAPLNRYSTIGKPLEMQQIGPGDMFGRVLYKKTGRKILLVVNARGGTKIQSWLPDAEDGYFDQAVIRAKEGMKYGKFRGILWHQGEGNSKSPDGYMDDLEVLVAALRKALAAEEVPFVAGEIAPWHPNRDRFNPIIRTVSEHIPHSACVSSEGCTSRAPEDPEDPHFGRDGQFLLGERYAEKIYDMVYKKNE